MAPPTLHSIGLPRGDSERCDVKCQSITSRGTIQVLQEDPRSDWNVICVGLRLLLALLLTWHCQKSEDGKWREGGGLFLKFM